MPDQPMGARLDGRRCTFRTWAPNASRVAVVGNFNEWDADAHPMIADAEGCWSVEVDGVGAGDEYLYRIDNRGGDPDNPGQQGLFRVDPWARAMRHSSGNGLVVDVAEELRQSGLADDGFCTPAATDWLIYQVHVGSFSGLGDGLSSESGTGTFDHFVTKLDYIRSLGFNAVALLPIHENPGDGNAGYAPAHLFAPESSFGSPLALRRLIRAAHDVGLAILFDVVWNHMADVDNRLWEFDGMTRDGGIFFEGGERSPWGPRLASWKREVRDFIVDHARMCFAEYHVDGLRIDAADEIAGELLTEVVATVRGEPMWHDKLLIVEWGGDDRDIQPPFDAPLHFDRLWALTDPRLFREAVGLGADSSVTARVAAMRQLIELPDAAARVRYLIGSHDNAHDNLAGARTGFRHFVELAGGRDDPTARAKARLGWALGIALPGTPMCFMGAECHQPGYWNPRPDSNPFHGDHRFDWSRCGDAVGAAMHALVTDTNRLWWDRTVLRQGDLTLLHLDGENGVVAFRRQQQDGDAVLTMVHLGDARWEGGDYRLPLVSEHADWRVVLDSQAVEYGGEGTTNNEVLSVTEGALALSLAPWSLLLLTPR